MPDNTAQITFNFNDGSPTWTVSPDSLPVPHGNNQNIIWSLTAQSTQGAVLSTTNGIVFKHGSNWPGTNPARQSGTRYTASENNANPGPGAVKYRYTINVDYNGTTYSHDPDVSNQPPSS